MKYIILLLVVLCYNALLAQVPVAYFTNPSFEGALNGWSPLSPPSGWAYCANSPDIFPFPLPTDPCLAIPAYDGNACIEMIAGNHPLSPEAIGQRLNVVLEQDSAYYFEIFMKSGPLSCGSTGYERLEIYLGQDSCQQSQLAYTSPILDSVWHSYIVPFMPTQPSTYIRFQPALQLPQFPDGVYVVNAQIDMLSPIYKGVYTNTGTIVRGRAISIYPNPTTNQLQINGDYTTATLYNLTGQLLLNTSSKQINLANFPQGMYILLCYDAAGRVIHREKVVKQ